MNRVIAARPSPATAVRPIGRRQRTSPWRCALELRSDRSIAAGNEAALCAAIRRGADLRVYTEWNYEGHVAPEVANPDPRHNGRLEEIIDMRETILVDDR